MTAVIQQALSVQSRRWLIGDRIAAILLAESARQKQLATDEDRDPAPYDIRVFRERSNPWDEYNNPEAEYADLRPIVNVWFDNHNIDRNASNSINRSKVTAVYNIDCYAIGLARETDDGHTTGDHESAQRSDETAEFVRAVLMSGYYRFLGYPRQCPVVWDRRVEAITSFQPQLENSVVQGIHATRVALHVDFNEEGPEATPTTLEEISVSVRSLKTGEHVLSMRLPESPGADS